MQNEEKPKMLDLLEFYQHHAEDMTIAGSPLVFLPNEDVRPSAEAIEYVRMVRELAEDLL